jgi:hypothetical protein
MTQGTPDHTEAQRCGSFTCVHAAAHALTQDFAPLVCIGSRGRPCRAVTSATILSVTWLISVGETSTPVDRFEELLNLSRRQPARRERRLVIEAGEARAAFGTNTGREGPGGSRGTSIAKPHTQDS